MNISDNLHDQHQKGFLDDEYYASVFVANIRRVGAHWRSAGIRENRPSFNAEVDRILAGTSS